MPKASASYEGVVYDPLTRSRAAIEPGVGGPASPGSEVDEDRGRAGHAGGRVDGQAIDRVGAARPKARVAFGHRAGEERVCVAVPGQAPGGADVGGHGRRDQAGSGGRGAVLREGDQPAGVADQGPADGVAVDVARRALERVVMAVVRWDRQTEVGGAAAVRHELDRRAVAGALPGGLVAGGHRELNPVGPGAGRGERVAAVGACGGAALQRAGEWELVGAHLHAGDAEVHRREAGAGGRVVHAVLIEVLERCARDRPGCFSRSGPAVRAQEGAGRQTQSGT